MVVEHKPLQVVPQLVADDVHVVYMTPAQADDFEQVVVRSQRVFVPRDIHARIYAHIQSLRQIPADFGGVGKARKPARLFVELHRGVDVAELAAVAGRAGGDADALGPQVRDDVGAGIPHQGHRQDVGGLPLPHRHNPGDGQQPLPAIGFDVRHVPEFLRQILLPQGHGPGKARDLGGGLGAGAQAPLLATAGQQGPQIPQGRCGIQSASALGPADLVGGQAHQIHPPAHRIAGDLQKALHRIAVQQGAAVFLP